MQVGKGQIHMVSLDRAGYAADKDDGPVRVLPLHDADVGQGVVDDTVSVVIPGIVEKDQVAGAHRRSLVKLAMPTDVMVNQPDAVRLRIR